MASGPKAKAKATNRPPRQPGIWTAEDLEDLKRCKEWLGQPGLAIRLGEILGAPIERGLKALPAGVSDLIHRSTRKAMDTAMNTALRTMGNEAGKPSRDITHRVMVAATGGVGGVAGLAGLPVELPVTTTIMLRSIAEIARSEGHSLEDLSTRMDCVLVLALGGPGVGDDAADTAFWASRAALSAMLPEVVQALGGKAVRHAVAPVVAKWLGVVASRFGVVITEEVAAKAVPVVGAVSGAAINVLFLQHFQRIARGHFVLRRLEKIHGLEAVQSRFRLGSASRETVAQLG